MDTPPPNSDSQSMEEKSVRRDLRNAIILMLALIVILTVGYFLDTNFGFVTKVSQSITQILLGQ